MTFYKRYSVDICATCLAERPPALPLREEVLSLGFEMVLNAAGTGHRASERTAKRAMHVFRKEWNNKALKKQRFWKQSSTKLKHQVAERRRLERQLQVLHALSYEDYARQLLRDAHSSISSKSSSVWPTHRKKEIILTTTAGTGKANRLLRIFKQRRNKSTPQHSRGTSSSSSISRIWRKANFPELLQKAPRVEPVPGMDGGGGNGNSLDLSSLSSSRLVPEKQRRNTKVLFFSSPVTQRYLPGLSTVPEPTDDFPDLLSPLDAPVPTSAVQLSGSGTDADAIFPDLLPPLVLSNTPAERDLLVPFLAATAAKPTCDLLVPFPRERSERQRASNNDSHKSKNARVQDPERRKKLQSVFAVFADLDNKDKLYSGDAFFECKSPKAVAAKSTKETDVLKATPTANDADTSTRYNVVSSTIGSPWALSPGSQSLLHNVCRKRIPSRSLDNASPTLCRQLVEDVCVYQASVAAAVEVMPHGPCMLDSSGDLAAHVAAGTLLEWESSWYEVVFNLAAAQDDDDDAGKIGDVVTQLYQLMSTTMEVLLHQLPQHAELCRQPGSNGFMLPAHLAAIFTATTPTQRCIMASYPAAAHMTCSLGNIRTFIPDHCTPLELHEHLSTDFPKWEVERRSNETLIDEWSQPDGQNFDPIDQIRRSDLLFAYNPTLRPFCNDEERLFRIERRIRREVSAVVSGRVGDISPTMKALWTTMCQNDDAKVVFEPLVERLFQSMALEGVSYLSKIAMAAPQQSSLSSPAGSSRSDDDKHDATSSQCRYHIEEQPTNLAKSSERRHSQPKMLSETASLCRAFLSIDAQAFPTTFVVLPYELHQSFDGKPALRYKSDRQLASSFAQCILRLLSRQYLAHVLISKFSDAAIPTASRASMRKVEDDLLSLYEPGRAFVYLIDERTGSAIVSDEKGAYPIILSEPRGLVRKLLPLMLVGIIVMYGDQAHCVIGDAIIEIACTDVVPHVVKVAKLLVEKFAKAIKLNDGNNITRERNLMSDLKQFVAQQVKASPYHVTWNTELSVLRMLLQMHDQKSEYAGLSALQSKMGRTWTIKAFDTADSTSDSESTTSRFLLQSEDDIDGDITLSQSSAQHAHVVENSKEYPRAVAISPTSVLDHSVSSNDIQSIRDTLSIQTGKSIPHVGMLPFGSSLSCLGFPRPCYSVSSDHLGFPQPEALTDLSDHEDCSECNFSSDGVSTIISIDSSESQRFWTSMSRASPRRKYSVTFADLSPVPEASWDEGFTDELYTNPHALQKDEEDSSRNANHRISIYSFELSQILHAIQEEASVLASLSQEADTIQDTMLFRRQYQLRVRQMKVVEYGELDVPAQGSTMLERLQQRMQILETRVLVNEVDMQHLSIETALIYQQCTQCYLLNHLQLPAIEAGEVYATQTEVSSLGTNPSEFFSFDGSYTGSPRDRVATQIGSQLKTSRLRRRVRSKMKEAVATRHARASSRLVSPIFEGLQSTLHCRTAFESDVSFNQSSQGSIEDTAGFVRFHESTGRISF